ncbi:Helix-turn-helix domain-containing protein [Halovenus aranensis]|jgi:DNA-binding transcriptional ArsR family regulator|uniref:Helix-turn-helix domain-containing protein n=1 Tax=Halovenus aranensis TaxID=890420 RepID=A0A1G8Y2Q8_9EURY|nr:helix-turn-helix domain-containing protein [Halovenus aranensis]SDJ97061.1 Helix-turn-helix domain-containing protein [Halovenus aranensis]
MARLFPSRTESSTDRDDDPAVFYVDDERTAEMISTLSGETALTIFRMLSDDALTASEIADDLDLSVQNASYHLDNLQEADLIEVIDTCYSEKGREMEIYTVTREPKILVLGSEDEGRTLRRAFTALAGAIGIPAVALAVWSSLSQLGRLLVER